MIGQLCSGSAVRCDVTVTASHDQGPQWRRQLFFFQCPLYWAQRCVQQPSAAIFHRHIKLHGPVEPRSVVGCTVVDIQHWRVVREPGLFDF